MALHEVGSNNPDGVEIKNQPKDPKLTCRSTASTRIRITASGYARRRGVLIVFSVIMFFLPEMGGYSQYNNFIPADPLKTPPYIAPVWHFTPYYSILRAIRRSLIRSSPACAAMGAATMILFLLPWLDRSPVKSMRYKGPIFKSAVAIFVVVFNPGLSRHRADQRLGPIRRGSATPIARPSWRASAPPISVFHPDAARLDDLMNYVPARLTW